MHRMSSISLALSFLSGGGSLSIGMDRSDDPIPLSADPSRDFAPQLPFNIEQTKRQAKKSHDLNLKVGEFRSESLNGLAGF